jgi:hypothetical protein
MGKGRGRVRKRLIVGGVVVVLIVGAIIGYQLYFKQKPEDMANDYRRDAVPAAAKITGGLDRVYASFNEYILESTIPVRELRNIDDIDELRRRVVPLYNDTEQALDGARRQIKAARKAIDSDQDALLETPSATFLDGSDPVKETEDGARQARAYIKRAERFLDDYAKFVDYAKDELDLDRRELEIVSQNEVEPDASLEALESSISAELEETIALRKVREKQKVHPDAEDLADNSLESINVTIDYLEQTDAAIDALDAAAFDAALEELLDESKRVGRRDSLLISKLSRESGITKSAEALSKQADELQDFLAEIGTEGKERDEPPRDKPIVPIPEPGAKKDGGAPSDSGDEQIS